MAKRDEVTIEGLRSVASDAVTTSYANLGTVTLQGAMEIKLTNGSDKAMVISLDGGTTDHIYLPPQSADSITPGHYDHAIKGNSQLKVKLLAAGAATAGTLVTATVITSKNYTI